MSSFNIVTLRIGQYNVDTIQLIHRGPRSCAQHTVFIQANINVSQAVARLLFHAIGQQMIGLLLLLTAAAAAAAAAQEWDCPRSRVLCGLRFFPSLLQLHGPFSFQASIHVVGDGFFQSWRSTNGQAGGKVALLQFLRMMMLMVFLDQTKLVMAMGRVVTSQSQLSQQYTPFTSLSIPRIVQVPFQVQMGAPNLKVAARRYILVVVAAVGSKVAAATTTSTVTVRHSHRERCLRFLLNGGHKFPKEGVTRLQGGFQQGLKRGLVGVLQHMFARDPTTHDGLLRLIQEGAGSCWQTHLG
mmetsp:Transcript_11336/g.31299  ORF Transcript_11336/g.31299 Transcript_11336/m.31299 type:complete len:298 (+) Transcript_11336:2946-3839(+)